MGQLLCRWALSQSPPLALYVGVDVGALSLVSISWPGSSQQKGTDSLPLTIRLWTVGSFVEKHLHSKIEGTFFSIHILLSVFFLTNESIPIISCLFFNGNVSSQPRRSSQAWHGPAYTGARVLCSSARRSGMVHLSTRVKERCADGFETISSKRNRRMKKGTDPMTPRYTNSFI